MLKFFTVKKILYAFLIFFIFKNLKLGTEGTGSIFLTISMYLLIGLIFNFLINILVKSSRLKVNFKLFIFVSLAFLLATEFVLRFTVKPLLNYAELRGDFYANSIYSQSPIEYITKDTKSQKKVIDIHRPNPDTFFYNQNSEFKYLQKYNSLGFRDNEPNLDSSFYNIIALGDSFTEGIGSSQDSTWVQLLEEILKTNNKNLKIQSINAGISGCDPINNYYNLQVILNKLNPNIVLITVNESDIIDVIIRGGKERFKNGEIKYNDAPWWEVFYLSSYIFRAISYKIWGINSILMNENQYNNQVEIALQKIEKSLIEDYKDLSKKQNFEMVIIFNPLEKEIKNKIRPFKSLKENLLKDSSFQVIDLYESFDLYFSNSNHKIEDYYWKNDLHNNSKGYLIWAQKVEPEIIKTIKKSKHY